MGSLIWLDYINILSNATIALAYFIISIILFHFYRRKKSIEQKAYIRLLFGGFLFTSGIKYLMDILLFSYDIYLFSVIINIFTVNICIITCILLPSVIRYNVSLKTPEELADINKKLQELIVEKEESEKRIQIHNHELSNEVHKLQVIISTQGWVAEKQMDLEAMKNVIKELRKEYVNNK